MDSLCKHFLCSCNPGQAAKSLDVARQVIILYFSIHFFSSLQIVRCLFLLVQLKGLPFMSAFKLLRIVLRYEVGYTLSITENGVLSMNTQQPREQNVLAHSPVE